MWLFHLLNRGMAATCNVLVPTLTSKQDRLAHCQQTPSKQETKQEREREDHNQITSEKETLHNDPPRICRHDNNNDNNNINNNQPFETLTSTGSNFGCRLTQSLVKKPQPRTRGDVCCVAAARATTIYFCSDKHKRAAATQCLAVERKMSSFLVVLVGVCVSGRVCEKLCMVCSLSFMPYILFDLDHLPFAIARGNGSSVCFLCRVERYHSLCGLCLRVCHCECTHSPLFGRRSPPEPNGTKAIHIQTRPRKMRDRVTRVLKIETRAEGTPLSIVHSSDHLDRE